MRAVPYMQHCGACHVPDTPAAIKVECFSLSKGAEQPARSVLERASL